MKERRSVLVKYPLDLENSHLIHICCPRSNWKVQNTKNLFPVQIWCEHHLKPSHQLFTVYIVQWIVAKFLALILRSFLMMKKWKK